MKTKRKTARKAARPSIQTKTTKLSAKPAAEKPVPVNGVSVANSPSWNIWDTGKTYKVRIPAPGLQKKHIKVDAHGNLLSVSCSGESKKKKSGKDYVVHEYSYNSWKRSIALPKAVKEKSIKIRYKDGLLKFELPKVKLPKVRKAKAVKAKAK